MPKNGEANNSISFFLSNACICFLFLFFSFKYKITRNAGLNMALAAENKSVQIEAVVK